MHTRSLPRHCRRMMVLVATLLTGPVAGAAAVYQINATRTAQPADTSGFLLTFEDVNGDGLLEAPEIRAFAQFSVFSNEPIPTVYQLTEVPTIAGLSQESGTCVVGPLQAWCVQWHNNLQLGGTGLPASFFTYSESVVSDVPEPSSWASLMLGLVGLALVRSRRRPMS